MNPKRINKAYYHTGPRLRMWLPLNRERRIWRAAHEHYREYWSQQITLAVLSTFDMEVGESRNGITCIAKATS